MSDSTDIQDAIDAGVAIAEPNPLDPGVELYTQVVPAGGQLQTIDVQKHLEPYLSRPRRKTGTVHVHSADSFVDYLEKHAVPETEVFADTSRHSLVGVINAHQEAVSTEDATASDRGAGHGDHRVALELVKTDAWKAWVALDRKYMDQLAFANHIEDNAIDILSPDPATLLEIIESFQASTSVEFKSAQRLHSGQVNFNYAETGGARAGQTGELEVPTEFKLELAPFEGGATYPVTARFRYRIQNSALLLSYHLVRPEDVLRQAFVDYVLQVDQSVAAPVFRGRPE
jgi:uncharacterized protein YfdQ (DUF2303 family)